MEAKDKIEIVNKYLDGVTNHDMEAIRDIFDEQATVEDPAGTDVHIGMEAICKFYEVGFSAGVKLESTGPVRCTVDAAVFPFIARASGIKIDVIDIFEFDENGKVKSMRAYWGPENMSSE